MRILLFLEICLIAVGIWSLVMMLYRLFLMPAKEDFGKYGFLYILDCGMSDETAQICRRFAREYGSIEIGSLAQLEQRLTGGGDLQP